MSDPAFYIPYIVSILCYTIILIYFVRYSSKKFPIDAVLGFSTLFVLFLHFSLIMYMMYNLSIYQVLFHINLLYPPILIVLIGVAIFSLIVNIYRVLRKKYGKQKDENKFLKRKTRIKKLKPVWRDVIRKIPHLIIFLSFFIIWWIGASVIFAEEGNLQGMYPADTDLFGVFFLAYTGQERNIFWHFYDIGWFYFFLLIILYCFVLSALFMEITRKSKHFSFPLNFISIYLLKDEEVESYGTFLYFFIGHLFAATFLAPLPFFAIMSMSSIGDLVASQVGIRTHKHCIRWNNDKCWEGTISSSIITIIITSIFVGFVWATLFSLLFFVIDLITRKPLNASDNLLIPICSTLLFVILHHAGLPYYSIFF